MANTSTSHPILVIDSSKLMCKLISQSLEHNGYKVISVTRVEDAVPIIQKTSITIVITAADLPEVTGLDLMVWLESHYPEIRVIITSANANQAMLDFVEHHRAYYLPKDQQRLDKLNTLVKLLLQNTALTAYGITFESQSLRLYDALQLLVIAKASCSLVLQNPQGESVGTLYFKQGKLIHAIAQKESAGQEALSLLMAIEQGQFQISTLPENVPLTLKKSFNQIISESAPPIQKPNEKKEFSFTSPENIRLLFVDDDDILILILQRHFQYAGYKVDVAHSAQQAIEMAKATDYHMILTDLNMPNMSGLELILSLQKYGSAAKLAVMTASLSEDLQEFLKKNGVVRLFLKPMRLEDLQAFIEYMFFKNIFKGKLSNLSTLAIIQTLAQSKDTVRLHMLDLRTNTTGELYINQGDLESAYFGLYTGQAALTEILDVKEGVLVELNYRLPTSSNLSISVNKLVAEQRAEIDEFYATLDAPVTLMGEEISAFARKVDALLKQP